MKSTLLHFLFVLALASTSLADHPLIDTSGEPILNGGGGYYISPLMRPGAPVQLAPTGGETCPRTLVQPLLGYGGVPVRFSSPLRIRYISTSMHVHVESLPPQHVPYTCLPSPARWKVEEDGSVKIVEEGEQTGLVGPFKIEGVGGGNFKLQYCEGQNDNVCKDIGVSSGIRRLIVNDGNPLIVRFVRASDINQYDNESEGIIKMAV